MGSVSYAMKLLEFLHVCFLNCVIEKFQWSCPEWKGIISRYEHSVYIPSCNPKKVHVFGGAQQATNLNDVQALDLGTLQFSQNNFFNNNDFITRVDSSFNLGNSTSVL